MRSVFILVAALVGGLGLALGAAPVLGQDAPWLAQDSEGNLYVIANRQRHWIVPREISDEDLALIPVGEDLLDGYLPAGVLPDEPEAPTAVPTPTPETTPVPPPPAVDIEEYILLGSVAHRILFIGGEQQLCVKLEARSAPPVPNVPVTFFAGDYQFHSHTGPDGKACVTVYLNAPGAYSFNAVARYGGRDIALEGYSDTGFAVLSP